MKNDSDTAWIPTGSAPRNHLQQVLCGRPQSLVSMSGAKIMRNEPRAAAWLLLQLLFQSGLPGLFCGSFSVVGIAIRARR
jgi:hypothetical protein